MPTPTPSPSGNKSRQDLIREYSEALLSADEISILLGMTDDEHRHFIRAVREKLHEPDVVAYYQGRLKTKYELHKMVITLAVKGSPAAQPIAERYLSEQ